MSQIETLADLHLVASEHEQAQEELKTAMLRLENASEKRRLLLEKLEFFEAKKPDLSASVEAVLSGVLDASDSYQFAIAERALQILRLRKEASECKTALVSAKSVDSDSPLLQLTPLVALVATLITKAKELAPYRDDGVVECQQRIMDLVKSAMKLGLAKIGWATEGFVKPNEWQEVSTCLDWLLTLSEGNVRAALKPMFDPLCKKFVFHFLETPASSRPDLFGQAVKWVLSTLTSRSDFLIGKVQHGAMIELVREMSLLIALRAKRDFSLLLKDPTSDKNKLFLETVDELFSFADVCDLHYDYSLRDEKLDHAAPLSLFPASGTFVTEYWLALERKAVEACKERRLMLTELQIRARRRLALLPSASQRQAYFDGVYAPILSEMTKRLQEDDDEIESLMDLSAILTGWSVRPEFDQDGDLLVKLSSECSTLFFARLEEQADNDARAFVSSLSPWLSKNWLYVSQAATAVLFSGDVHLDLSAELCSPYEKLRNVLRDEELRLRSAYSQYALKLAEFIDIGMVNLILEISPPFSFELAKQFAFDLNLVFGLWSNVVVSSSSSRLFKRLSDVLSILQMDENELTAVCAAEKMEPEHQRLFLFQRFQLQNLEPDIVNKCAKLRQDRP